MSVLIAMKKSMLILTTISPVCSVHIYFLMNTMQYKKVAQSYKTSCYAPTWDFSSKRCNSWVRKYNKNFNGKDNNWWSSLLEHYNVAEDGYVETLHVSMLDEGWRPC
jgi:hypothetical protein